MGLLEKNIEPGVNPHEYIRRRYPSYRYINKSIDKNFLIGKRNTFKYDNLILITTHDGMNYLFRRG